MHEGTKSPAPLALALVHGWCTTSITGSCTRLEITKSPALLAHALVHGWSMCWAGGYKITSCPGSCAGVWWVHHQCSWLMRWAGDYKTTSAPGSCAGEWLMHHQRSSLVHWVAHQKITSSPGSCAGAWCMHHQLLVHLFHLCSIASCACQLRCINPTHLCSYVCVYVSDHHSSTYLNRNSNSVHSFQIFKAQNPYSFECHCCCINVLPKLHSLPPTISLLPCTHMLKNLPLLPLTPTPLSLSRLCVLLCLLPGTSQFVNTKFFSSAVNFHLLDATIPFAFTSL